MSFHELSKQLHQAQGPEDIFGALAGMTSESLKQRYRTLAAIAHPDRNPHQRTAAEDAFKSLHHWYGLAQRCITARVTTTPAIIDITTRRSRYTGSDAPLQGDLCELYPCSDEDGQQVLLKVVRHPRNNDLLQAEAQTLRRLERELHGQPIAAHFPKLIETFELADDTGAQRRSNVLLAEEGYVTLAAVRRAYPAGIDPADAAWMFNRVLAALGVLHGLGLVHGGLTPEHILVRPTDHNGLLLDWCYSVRAGEIVQAISPAYAQLAPPEVQRREPATSVTDLYMAAGCMVQLLGGSGQMETLPKAVPRPLRNLLAACLIQSPHRRAGNAWQIFDDFKTLLAELYGPPTFRPFTLLAGHANTVEVGACS